MQAGLDAEPADRMRSVGLWCVVGLAIGHALLFAGYVVDDAYISFRYARNLASGIGLVYNAGEHVEGYTNFSWVMLAAAGQALGVAPTLSMPLVGLLCGLTLVLVVVSRARRFSPDLPWAGLAAGAIVAASTGLAFYSVSGLETVLFALLMTLAASALCEDRPTAFALYTSLAFSTRPEAGLLGVLGSALLFARSAHQPWPARRRVIVKLAVVFGLLVAPYLIWKWTYFGALLPNTALAKPPDVTSGAHYLVAGVWPSLGLLALACWSARTRYHARVLLACVLGYWAATALEGGDWMPACRLLVPYLPCLALAADPVLALALAAPRADPRRLIACAAALLLYAAPQLQGTAHLTTKARDTLSMDERRAQVFAALRAQHVQSVAAYDIGLLGYLLPDTQIIDLGGLVDHAIARTPGGHGEKRIPIAYLQHRAPARILLATDKPERLPDGSLRVVPVFPVESEIQESAWFQSHYAHAASYAVSLHYFMHVFAPGPEHAP